MKYLVVIQFQEELYDDLNWIAEIEDQLDELLIDAELDGHDIGSGEINIFIHSNDSVSTFNVVKNILTEENFELENIKIAYREMNGQLYVPLWPKNLVTPIMGFVN